jgi:hypothetical protein
MINKLRVTVQKSHQNLSAGARAKSNHVVVIPTIKELPSYPQWEATERRIARHNNRQLPPFEE